MFPPQARLRVLEMGLTVGPDHDDHHLRVLCQRELAILQAPEQVLHLIS
jgi:hypothetical protein